MPTKAEIQAELDALRAEHESLKDRVVQTAKDYADAHGWCGVVGEALQDMGLLGPAHKRVTITFDVDGEHHGLSDWDDDDEWVEAVTAIHRPGIRVLGASVEDAA